VPFLMAAGIVAVASLLVARETRAEQVPVSL